MYPFLNSINFTEQIVLNHFVNRVYHIIIFTFIVDSSGNGLSTAGIIGIVIAAGVVTVGIIIAVGCLVKYLKG